MIQISVCGRRGLDKLGAAEKLVLDTLRRWKMRRAERLATLPELHERLAPLGGAMLAVPLDDFFKQITPWRNCPHKANIRYSDQLICDEVATLDLLQTADDRFAQSSRIGSAWDAARLLLLSAWILRRQFTTELGLRFGSLPVLQPRHGSNKSREFLHERFGLLSEPT